MASQMNCRGQVAMWVIVAVVVVAVVGLFFAFSRGPDGVIIESKGNPETFLKGCVRDVVKSGVDEILPKGGLVENRVSVLYKNRSVEYLCKTSTYYEPCINQHPTYLTEALGQLKEEITPEIESCFTELEAVLEERNVDVDLSGSDFELDFAPGRIFVDLDERIEVVGEGGTVLDGLRVEVASPLYDLMTVAVEVANQESEYCHFSDVGYSLFYPNFRFSTETFSDGTKVYTVEELDSEKELYFAIRGCVLPAGLG